MKKVAWITGLLIFLAPLGVWAESAVEGGSPQEEHIRVVRTGGMSPFRSIEWSVVSLDGTPLARHRKTMVNYSENIASMRLLTLDEYQDLWTRIESAGALTAPQRVDGDGRREDGGVRYEVEMAKEGTVWRWVVDDSSRATQGHVAFQVARLVEDTVETYTEKLPFRNVFFDPGVVGFVDVDSIPEAKVYIDGRDIQKKTPVHTYEMRAGEHSIRLVTEDGAYDRTYTFRIQAGMTTVLRLDLR